MLGQIRKSYWVEIYNTQKHCEYDVECNFEIRVECDGLDFRCTEIDSAFLHSKYLIL